MTFCGHSMHWNRTRSTVIVGSPENEHEGDGILRPFSRQPSRVRPPTPFSNESVLILHLTHGVVYPMSPGQPGVLDR